VEGISGDLKSDTGVQKFSKNFKRDRRNGVLTDFVHISHGERKIQKYSKGFYGFRFSPYTVEFTSPTGCFDFLFPDEFFLGGSSPTHLPRGK